MCVSYFMRIVTFMRNFNYFNVSGITFSSLCPTQQVFIKEVGNCMAGMYLHLLANHPFN